MGEQQQPQSYDMTPARHELPPDPLADENNYGLEDLDSDAGTDDEDCPRKQVPKWAEGTNLRTALLKQCYMPPDLDQIFATVEMPIYPPCLWNNGRGFSREQAVLAGSSRQKVSSTAQEGLDFEIVRCYRRLFVRYISFLVTPDRTK